VGHNFPLTPAGSAFQKPFLSVAVLAADWICPFLFNLLFFYVDTTSETHTG
jgi:hypothetical protein